MGDFESFRRFKKNKEIKTDTEKINEAWFYPRVSSKNQFDNNDSIENQSEVSHTYARKNGIVITKTFGGTYESASGDFTRKEFMKLINEIKRSRKRPKYVLIYIMSRFSRTGGNAIALANMLVEDMGVHLIETSSGLSTETDLGKMAVYQKLIEARKETLSRLDSTIPGMKNALLSGKWLGAVPKGYTKFGPRVKEQERFSPFTRIEINEEGKLLKLAWKWKTQGERDVDILRKLEAKGLILNNKRLSEIWRKPFYAGMVVHSLIDNVVEGNWEPMVSKKNFLKINKLLEENNHTKNGYSKERIEDLRPLNGDLICSECGAKLTSYRIKKEAKTTGRKYDIHYYNCYKCKAVTVNANSSPNSRTEGLHNQFENILKSFQIEKKYQDILEQYLLKIVNNRNKDLKKEIKEDKKQITELKSELQNIKRRYAFGKVDKELYDEFSKELIEKILTLEKKTSEGDYSTSNQSKKIKLIIKKVQNLDKLWANGTFQFKKSLQKAMFPRGIVVKADSKQLLTDNINEVFYIISCFTEVCKQNKSGESNRKLDYSALVPRGGLEPPTS